MPRSLRPVLFAVALAAAAAGGALLYRQQAAPAAPVPDSPRLPAAALTRLMALSLDDSAGRPQAFSQWQGKILVVNFWATWCAPCREEMPAFSRLQAKLGGNGVQVVGIGIDSPSAIKEYAYQTPQAYPLLIGGSDGLELMGQLGNTRGALPYTLVIDRRGQPSFSRLGLVSETQLENLLSSLAAS